jgi:hypothetical protein
MFEQLLSLVKKYKRRGATVVGAVELALSPAEAMEFADEVGKLGIAITGVDGWFYIGDELAQAIEVDFYVGDDVLVLENKVALSVENVKEYIQSGLPKRVDKVSFTFDIPVHSVDFW